MNWPPPKDVEWLKNYYAKIGASYPEPEITSSLREERLAAFRGRVSDEHALRIVDSGSLAQERPKLPLVLPKLKRKETESGKQ